MHPLSYFQDSDLDDFVNFQTAGVVELRDWQRRAINSFRETKYNLILECATGVGKSRCAVEMLKLLLIEDPKIRTLIAVPKNVILETGWYKELVDAGIPIQDIGVFYGGIKEYARITITNMQNIHKIPLELFDFLIVDEAHNFATKKQLAIISRPFKYRLGLSATIKRQDYKHFDLLKVFNYNVFKYDPSEALSDGVLNNFDFVNIGIYMDFDDKEEYDNLSHQYNQVLIAGGGFSKIMNSTGPLKNKMLYLLTERKKLVNNYKYKFNIVRELIQKHKDDKVIVFNQFIDQTNKMYWNLVETGLSVRVIHSDVSNEERDKTLIDFREGRFNILITTKVLDEGYNLPKLDVAIITAGDSADKQTIQRMGRVLRKKDKNSKIYQLFCLNTIEQESAEARARIFKKLALSYKDITYDENSFAEEIKAS